MRICTRSALTACPALRADEIEALQITLGSGNLSHPAGTPGRKQNGLITVAAGGCTYAWTEADTAHTAELTVGRTIYLPRGAHYVLKAQPGTVIHRVSFRLYGGDEELLFSATPSPVADGGGGVARRCAAMCAAGVPAGHSLRAMSQLFALLDEICRMGALSETGRVGPALTHIRAHIDANTPVRELAQMCYLSEAQFFRLFRQSVGCSPIRYRNRLRVERAQALLTDEELTVGAVAALLGFESIYYFDRIFRQYTGTTPGHFRMQPDKKPAETLDTAENALYNK